MELMILWLIVWIASPLVLIPMCVSFGKKKSRLENFMRELLSNGRISGYEYQNLRTEATRTVSAAVKKAQTSSVSKDAVSAAADKVTDMLRDIPQISAPVKTVMSAPEPTKGFASASVLFGIGVAFVILAGFIFSTAIWVYLSDWARTGIIALAGLLFFGISSVAKKKFRLDNTSNAFYMLGSVFSVICFVTAGIFGLFGEWFSTFGGGVFIFFAFAFFILAGFSAYGAKLYSKVSCTYISLFSILTGITLIFGQCCDEYEMFSLSISIFAAAATGAYYYFRKYTGTEISAPAVHALIAMRVIYGCISVPHLVAGLFDLSGTAFALAVLWLAELTFYGIAKNNKIMLSVQSLFAVAAGFEIFGYLNENISDKECLFGFALLNIALAFVYRYIKAINTRFAEKTFIMASFVSGAALLDFAVFPYGVLSMLAVEALVFVMALDMSSLFNRIYRVLLPIPFVCIGFGIEGELFHIVEDFENAWVWIGCTALFTAIAYGCGFMLRGDRRFASIKYSFEFFAGLSLVYSVINGCTEAVLIATIVLGIVLIAEIHTSSRNIHSLVPVYAVFAAVSDFISTTASDYAAAGDTLIIVSIILCAVLTFISRIAYGENIRNTRNGRSHWDIFAAGILFCVLLMDHSSNMFTYDARVFIILTELAVFAGNLFRKEHGRAFNSWSATASAALFSLALINRPFMVIEDDVVAGKVILLIIVAFGFAAGKIWRRNVKFAESFSSGVYMLAYGLLLFDALINETLFNTLIVLCTSLAILIYAFMKKKKRWFIASAAGLAGLTLYITKDFLSEIDWWIYLLLAGILLISIASANEYFKGKGAEVKARAGRFFEEWEW